MRNITNVASLSKQHICIFTFRCTHMSDAIRVVLGLDGSSRISFILKTPENICLYSGNRLIGHAFPLVVNGVVLKWCLTDRLVLKIE